MEQDIYKDILSAMKMLHVEYIPSRADLESIGMGYISSRISRNGGYRACEKKFGIPCKGHTQKNTKWNEISAINEIIKVKNVLGLNRMPTRNELNSVLHNCALTSYISKSDLGYYGFAKKLNLGIKDCETTFGKEYEFIILDYLKSLGYKVEKMSQNYPYDILVNDYIKVDSKVSNLYSCSNGKFYSFAIGKKYLTCDIYIFTCINELNGFKYYIIPACVISKHKQVSIGEHCSKYDKYINKWDYIQQFDTYYQHIMKEA